MDILVQLYSYLRDNNLLSQKQFGFRLNSSTVTVSAMFTDKTLSAMDKGQLILVPYLLT